MLKPWKWIGMIAIVGMIGVSCQKEELFSPESEVDAISINGETTTGGGCHGHHGPPPGGGPGGNCGGDSIPPI